MSKPKGVKYSFFTDRFIVLMAYLAAIVGAWVSVQFIPEADLWIRIALGDLVGTVIIFIFSLVLRNSSMYDPYWSVIPIIILLYIFVDSGAPLNVRNVLVSVVVIYWGVRLTLNWLKTWPGLRQEDWRYIKLAKDSGPLYWLVSFLGIHLFPTIMVFLGCLPLIPIVQSESGFIWTDLAGFVISFIAVEIERRSDNQLRIFKNSDVKGSVCEEGLWKYSRHPNYFGEITFWAGLFVMAFALAPQEHLIYGMGLLCMIVLFVFISIPMMEKRQMLKEGYAAYRKQVPMLVPWFRRK